MDSSLIFQRTHSGKVEIYEKSHGLTQSERLVLIMVDGITCYGDVKNRLPVLQEARFARAFLTLIHKELITEVFLPLSEQVAEAVERTVIDRFLQQDPLDPVTIIVHDIEETFETNVASMSPQAFLPSSKVIDVGNPGRVAQPTSMENDGAAKQLQDIAMDDTHIAMIDALAKELKERHRSDTPRVVAASRGQRRFDDVHTPLRNPGTGVASWPYWSIGIGSAFIAGFVAAKFLL